MKILAMLAPPCIAWLPRHRLPASLSILQVYASNPARTPPLVATVLQNTGVLFAVPFSIWLLGDRKKYWSPLALTASTLIVASVVVSVLPTILKGGNSISGKDIGWILIYLGGMLPGALYNTLQQRLLIKAGVLREDATFGEITTATLRMLFYSNACQTLCLVALFWLDLLPWFGYSSSLTDFWNNTVFSLTCSFAGPSGAVALSGSGLSPSDCGSRTPVWAFTFIAGYTTTYIAGALLNRQSSTYNMLLFVLITMTTSAFWLIPGTNPNPENTPMCVAAAAGGPHFVVLRHRGCACVLCLSCFRGWGIVLHVFKGGVCVLYVSFVCLSSSHLDVCLHLLADPTPSYCLPLAPLR